ncbi:LURP-one-related/scramblase family protein [Halobaculum marinum]|uniref:LURP-one-related/scramblase family protein n=1 Tax=Halobaculum marinum TaxID=3031996 RepID=A0ABD5WWZ7_9EURY|nr:LURP-one-related family protein [Halobaculum sp. DT55]
MTQKLISIGDDFFVENSAGERVFKIDGKALRVRDTLRMTDLRTGDTYTIQEKLLRVRNSMTIQRNGHPAASVHKAVVSPIRNRFTVSIQGGTDLAVKGNVLNHEYKLMRDGDRVAEVSKKWFRVRDSYGIQVSPDLDAGLVVACTIAIDMIVHPTR